MRDNFNMNYLNKNKSAQRVLMLLAVVAAFFPWVSFGTNALDTQPWFLVVGGIYLLSAMGMVRRRTLIVWFFMWSAILTLLFLHESDWMNTLRGMGTYISAAFALLVFDKYLDVPVHIRLKILIWVNIIWLLYPLLQFANIDLPIVQSRTSDSRGLTSLAPEPTFFGIFSLTMIAILLLEQVDWSNPKRGWFTFFVWANLTSIFFVAKSSSSIFLLAVIGLWYLLVYRVNLLLIILIICLPLFFLITYISFDFLNDASSRPLILLSLFIDHPDLILTTDESINARVSAIYVSIRGAFDSFLVPQGLRSFAQISESYAETSEFVIESGNKVMSFIGAFLFELGFIGVIYFGYVVRAVFNQPIRHAIFWSGALLLVLLIAVPVGFPLIGYVVALLNRRPRILVHRNRFLDSNTIADLHVKPAN